MSKLFKSLIIGLSLLHSANTYSTQAEEWTTATKIAVTCGATAASVVGLYGLYKFVSWAYYYSIDNTPGETFKIRFSYQAQTVIPFLEDFETYLTTKLTLPLIINTRYSHSEYPTLTYYDNLQKFQLEFADLETAFERKKSKTKDINEIISLEHYLQQIAYYKERIQNFQNVIAASHAYKIEQKAKYPPQAPIETLVIYQDRNYLIPPTPPVQNFYTIIPQPLVAQPLTTPKLPVAHAPTVTQPTTPTSDFLPTKEQPIDIEASDREINSQFSLWDVPI